VQIRVAALWGIISQIMAFSAGSHAPGLRIAPFRTARNMRFVVQTMACSVSPTEGDFLLLGKTL
jgi:hypothetical protein